MGQTRALAGASPAPVNLPGKDYQAVGLHIWKVTPSAGPMVERYAGILEAWAQELQSLAIDCFSMFSGIRHL